MREGSCLPGYKSMLRARQHPRVERALDAWRRWRGEPAVRPESEWLAEFVAAGNSFVDIGGMWGMDGEIAVRAAELGASPVTVVDAFSTEAFEAKRQARAPHLRFLAGLLGDPDLVRELGKIDRVWCWGVLYHHPAPAALLASLRVITAERLLLETRTIPEVPGVAQAAVFWPYLSPQAAKQWRQARHTNTTQFGIDTPYDPELRGANDFWGLSPSAVVALAKTCGLECRQVARSPKGLQRQIFEFEPAPIPYLFGFGEAAEWDS
jgi:hypothetical protein